MPNNNDNEKKQHYLQKKNPKITKEAYTDRSKSMGNKVDFAAIFRDITRRVALFEEASIHISKMAAIKVALKEIHKEKKGNMYRLSELYAVHQIQKKNITQY